MVKLQLHKWDGVLGISIIAIFLKILSLQIFKQWPIKILPVLDMFMLTLMIAGWPTPETKMDTSLLIQPSSQMAWKQLEILFTMLIWSLVFTTQPEAKLALVYQEVSVMSTSMLLIMLLGVSIFSSMIIATMKECQLKKDTIQCIRLFKQLEDKFSTLFATGEMKE